MFAWYGCWFLVWEAGVLADQLHQLSFDYAGPPAKPAQYYFEYIPILPSTIPLTSIC